MYYIYLYSDNKYSKHVNQYGYWTGKSYTVQGEEYPVCENDEYKRKEYKSLKRAISSGEAAKNKYGYVCGFDVEDENENIVYELHGSSSKKSEKNNRFAWNDVIHELNQMNNGTEYRKRTIQGAVKYIEEAPEELSDSEIDEYLKCKYPDREFQWCDGDKDVFGDF